MRDVETCRTTLYSSGVFFVWFFFYCSYTFLWHNQKPRTWPFPTSITSLAVSTFLKVKGKHWLYQRRGHVANGFQWPKHKVLFTEVSSDCSNPRKLVGMFVKCGTFLHRYWQLVIRYRNFFHISSPNPSWPGAVPRSVPSATVFMIHNTALAAERAHFSVQGVLTISSTSLFMRSDFSQFLDAGNDPNIAH